MKLKAAKTTAMIYRLGRNIRETRAAHYWTEEQKSFIVQQLYEEQERLLTDEIARSACAEVERATREAETCG